MDKDALIEKALQALQSSQQKYKTLFDSIHEPIAIIGASCRFSGCSSIEDFWNLLYESRDGISEIPINRWDISKYYDPNPKAEGKMYVREGGFVENIDLFDPLFFGISPREALTLDPQQRLLLEVCWEAFERAGISPLSVKNSLGGVFIGLSNLDYLQIVRESVQHYDSYTQTGDAHSTASGRISYSFGLIGPSISVDTACSSSLVAIHLACQSLRLKECNFALAGGVNLLLTPDSFIECCKAKMLSPENRCKTFDASANGFARGEGCGIVVLKRLSDALKSKDPVLAVIRSSAINQDGPSAGLTVPNSLSQRSLITKALNEAHLKPNEIDYVEAHGTGTSLGDPIEVEALDVLHDGRQDPLFLGSVKSNIGHTESAAGIASVIKVVLALQKELIPKNLNFNQLNPLINLKPIPAEVVKDHHPWKRENRVRRAGISSFGISGTNAHMIIEEAPKIEKVQPLVEAPLHLLTLSAKNEKALQDLAQRYRTFIEQNPNASLADIAFTANMGRAQFEYRLAIVAENPIEALNLLNTVQFKTAKKSNRKSILDNRPSQHSTKNEWKQFLEKLADEYLQGDEIDWKAFYEGYDYQKIILPTYPFQRERYWVEKIESPTEVALHPEQKIHPLLGSPIPSPLQDKLFENRLTLDELPYLKDHQILHHFIVPGTVYVEMALAAGKQLLHSDQLILENLSFEQPLTFENEKASEIQIVASPIQRGFSSSIYSSSEADDEISWEVFAKTNILAVEPNYSTPVIDLNAIQLRCPTEVSISKFYHQIAETGLQYGEQFQTITMLSIGQEEVLADLQYACEKDYVCNPVLLDGCLHSILALVLNEKQNDIYVPLAIDKVSLYAPLEPHVKVHGIITQRSDDMITADFEIVSPEGNLLVMIQGFHNRKLNHEQLNQFLEKSNLTKQWMYEIDWHERPLEIDNMDLSRLKGSWLVFSNNCELSQSVIQQIQKEEGRCLIIGVEEAVNQSKEKMQIYLQKASEMENFKGVLYLWGQTSSDTVNLESIKSGLQLSLKNLLYLTQAINNIETIPLYIATQGHQLEKSPLLGFFKTLQLEFPNIKCRYIDLDPKANPISLLAELTSIDDEDQVTYRFSLRYVPRLIQLKTRTEPNNHKIHSESSYLITGGLGGIGLIIANWLASKGAKHIVLVGRHAPQESASQVIKQIEMQGTCVEIAQLDIALSQDVADLMQNFGQVWPELKGIVHAAGVLEDALISSQDWSRFEKVLAPKVFGGWNLHEYSQKKPLDFFVLFSSVSATFGYKGQANYAAANAFLDGLADFRRQRNLPTTSINWGTWGEVGMAIKHVDYITSLGYLPMKTEEALKGFEYVLQHDQPHLIFAKLDWKVLFQSKGLKKLPWISNFIPSELGQKPKAFSIDITSIGQKELKELIQDIVKDVFKLHTTQMINDDEEFFNLGMDSLMAIELKNKLQEKFNQTFSSTLVFDKPNIRQLTDHIFELLRKEKGPTQPQVFEPASLLVPIHATGIYEPLFVIHPVGGDVFPYYYLAKVLGDDYSVYGIRAKGLEAGETPHSSLNEMANDYIAAIRTIQKKGPYFIAGWSSGSIISLEIAHHLEQQGEDIHILACIDMPNFLTVEPIVLNQMRFFFDVFNSEEGIDIEFSEEEYATLDDLNLRRLFLTKAQALGALPSSMDFDEFERLFQVFENIKKNTLSYVHTPFKNVKHLYLFEAKLGILDTLKSVRKAGKRIEIEKNNHVEKYLFDCNHFEIIKPPHINIIAQTIKSIYEHRPIQTPTK